MDKVVTTESLQYVVAIINAVKDSPLGILALICLGVGFIFYVVSAYRAFNIYSFLAYALTLAFFGIIVFAVYHTTGTIKTIYYAGPNENVFNVGRLTRLSDSDWEESSIVSFGAAATTGYRFHFINPQYQGKALILTADPVERDGAIEIDFDTGTIWWLEEKGQKKKLYQIVVAL
ncbi:MAG TPA: hypothetical protein VEK75_08000 [Xanthobacteraceae bacterium]|nr:hypothetical protein [Xanthobacteraceae bacterium]